MIGAVDPSDVGEFDRMRGMKRYELSNHLGNVLTVISDRKIATVDNGVNIYYHAEIISYTDYYPFGAPMSQGTTDRTWSVEEYRYGFNGKEEEVEFIQDTYNFEARFYDGRLGKFLTVDPLWFKFPWQSSYCGLDNNPICLIDPDGMSTTNPSTDVTENDDGTYTVVGAHNDGDNNIYVVDDKGKRTHETIGTTMRPYDFMSTNNKTGEFKFDKNETGVTFDLSALTVSGTVKVNEFTEASINDADAQELLNWGMQLFNGEVSRQSPATFYGKLEILREMSRNKCPLDFKVSLGRHQYTALKAGSTSDGKPIITTLRAMGNITFGANVKSTKPAWAYEAWYFSKVMEKAGEYNRSQHNGKEYNKGFPYFGEHTYSGSFIYYGYFGRFYGK
jgi:RHS repeat-associated protein